MKETSPVAYMDCPRSIKIIAFDDNGRTINFTADYAINQELSRRMEARDNESLPGTNKTIETG